MRNLAKTQAYQAITTENRREVAQFDCVYAGDLAFPEAYSALHCGSVFATCTTGEGE